MSAALAVRAPRAFAASKLQQAFFDWIAKGRGNAILKAVAGSGKSTSIVRALPYIPVSETVLILAFNTPIAKEMRAKVSQLAEELGDVSRFRNVEAATFHARGFKALCAKFGRDVKVEVDGGKVRKILKDRLSEDEYEMYGDFVAKLVGYGKGIGVGIPGLAADVPEVWFEIIAGQDMWLDDEKATEGRAVEIARKALAASNRKAETERWIDFDDQLYLPLLWNLRLFPYSWVFVDEAQDTNPVRREFARKVLRRDGRLVAVGDPRQAIYAFTGASADAMDVIAREFKTVELPLTTSYRCPKAVGELARMIVPYFDVFPGAIEGEVVTLPLKDALPRLDASSAILCRKTAPLISLAFKLIAEGRGCFVLGKDIGAGLSALVKKLRPKGVESLLERMDAYAAKEWEINAKKGDVAKTEALQDRIDCIKTVIESIPVPNRTVPAVLAKIDELFADGTGEGVLTLCTMHKAKGREWHTVAIYGPEMVPLKSAKSEAAFEQECNLLYVAQTRAMETLILIPGEDRR